jgi:hypothetical protein
MSVRRIGKRKKYLKLQNNKENQQVFADFFDFMLYFMLRYII